MRRPRASPAAPPPPCASRAPPSWSAPPHSTSHSVSQSITSSSLLALIRCRILGVSRANLLVSAADSAGQPAHMDGQVGRQRGSEVRRDIQPAAGARLVLRAGGLGRAGRGAEAGRRRRTWPLRRRAGRYHGWPSAQQLCAAGAAAGAAGGGQCGRIVGRAQRPRGLFGLGASCVFLLCSNVGTS